MSWKDRAKPVTESGWKNRATVIPDEQGIDLSKNE